ncbi:unnamed protein product [Moneuplotes crassus]|uniref:Uncharacterized protein n=1 Tax=Euplotes crassus TaxID=5936 RepID=A0AAD1XNS1_EUPCR|nr:unnamed protein product [Moneuplotes crassus]
MKLVYTKKGLEFRKSLKSDIETQQFRVYSPKLFRKKSSKFKLSSFLKDDGNEIERTLQFPDFENVNVELIQTERGEIKEKPYSLVSELKTNKFKKKFKLFLDKRSSSRLRDMLKDVPTHLHKNASKEMILPPKNPLHTSSFLETIGTVESPSHWRFFENKRKSMPKIFSPDQRISRRNSISPSVIDGRHFSPELTRSSFNNIENKFPFNVEKIFRKHSQQEAKRQVISLIVLRQRKLNELKQNPPKLPEYYTKLEQSLTKTLNKKDTSKERYKQRVSKLHHKKYQKQWDSLQLFSKLSKPIRKK